ncbi:MAG: SoxR reducing system RseC family protein [Candidatus Omnitrophica bacterium]|nr:SoxR reducing system RseC family protein [Candidatus Omnitrophota bacterium]
MFKEKAKVIAKDADTLTIRFQRKVQCGCCRLGNLCAPREEKTVLKVRPHIDAKEGDMIEVGIEEAKPLLISVLLFLVPTVILLATLILVRRWGEFRSFFLSIVNISVYFVFLKMLLKRKPFDCSLMILRKL